MSARPAPELVRLVRELDEARDAFLAALDDVDPTLLDAPGLVGDWSGRQLLGHMAGWAEHAGDALAAAARSAADEFGDEGLDVEALNAQMARTDAAAPLAELRIRESAAATRLREALEAADPAWLEERVAYGDSLLQVIRDDAADHYREHTADIRAWFAAGADEDEAEHEDEA